MFASRLPLIALSQASRATGTKSKIAFSRIINTDAPGDKSGCFLKIKDDGKYGPRQTQQNQTRNENLNQYTHTVGFCAVFIFAIVRMWCVGMSDFRRVGTFPELVHMTSLVVFSFALMVSALYHRVLHEMSKNGTAESKKTVQQSATWRNKDWYAVYISLLCSVVSSMAIAFHESSGELVTNAYADTIVATLAVLVYFTIRNIICLPDGTWAGQETKNVSFDEWHDDGPTRPTRVATATILGSSVLLHAGKLLSKTNTHQCAGLPLESWTCFIEIGSLLLMLLARGLDVHFFQHGWPTHAVWHIVVLVSGISNGIIRELVLASWWNQ